MGRRARLHREALQAGTDKPFVQTVVNSRLFRCGKCLTVFSEMMAVEHLSACWPDGAPCTKCGQDVKPAEFLEHEKACTGKPPDVETHLPYVSSLAK